jgi:hypothetical protein
MALKIDTSGDLRIMDELVELIKANYDAPPGAQETNFLEWKSSLDLDTLADKFAVAKAILGFANRSLDQASLACEGAAYLVVGVAPGQAKGVEDLDHAKFG